MNIEINIETLLFGNDAYTDHTNSKMFEKVRFILLSRKTDYVLQVSSFCFICFFSDFAPFSPVCINSWLICLPLISNTMLYICFAVILYYMCIVHVRRGFNKSCNNLCPILLLNLSQLNSITLHKMVLIYGHEHDK